MRNITKKLIDSGVIKFNKKSENTYEYVVEEESNYLLLCFNTIFDQFYEVYKDDGFHYYLITISERLEDYIKFFNDKDLLKTLKIYKKENIF